MARINVDDDLFTDVRFEKLIDNLGDKHTATGLMVDAWRTAQKYWMNDKELVPIKIWSLGGDRFQKLIEFCLAEIRDSGVYVAGSEKQFSWLLQKKEAGKQSAKSRKDKFGTAQPMSNDVQTKSEQSSNVVTIPLNEIPNGPEPLTLTPTLTPTLTQNINTKNLNTCPKVNFGRQSGEKSSSVWDRYSAAYKLRYGQAPARNAKENSICSKLVQAVGLECAENLAEFYVRHNDQWYVKKMHPLNILLADFQKIRTEMLSGNIMTSDQAERAEVRAANDEVFKNYFAERNKANEL
jgi:hypothetical protein